MRLLVLCGVSFVLTGAVAWQSSLVAAPAPSARKAAPKKKTASPPTATKKGPASAAKRGSASASSRRAVGRRATRRRAPARPVFVGQQRPAPERIQEIERALAARGFFQAEPDGTWDDATSDALKRFQASQTLHADGRLNAMSIIALGLGPRAIGGAAPALAPAVEPVQTPQPPLPPSALPPAAPLPPTPPPALSSSAASSPGLPVVAPAKSLPLVAPETDVGPAGTWASPQAVVAEPPPVPVLPKREVVTQPPQVAVAEPPPAPALPKREVVTPAQVAVADPPSAPSAAPRTGRPFVTPITSTALGDDPVEAVERAAPLPAAPAPRLTAKPTATPVAAPPPPPAPAAPRPVPRAPLPAQPRPFVVPDTSVPPDATTITEKSPQL